MVLTLYYFAGRSAFNFSFDKPADQPKSTESAAKATQDSQTKAKSKSKASDKKAGPMPSLMGDPNRPKIQMGNKAFLWGTDLPEGAKANPDGSFTFSEDGVRLVLCPHALHAV